MQHHDSRNKNNLNNKKISEILATLPDNFTKTKTTVGELKEALSGRAYGILLLVLALPNLIPIPAPGLSFLLGAPLILVTFQLMIGLKTPWLPQFIAKRTIKTASIRSICSRITPYMQMLERVIAPRFIILTAPPADRIISFICIILSLMIMMPIPFGNAFPALAICLFAIGILQRDGLFVILGTLVTLLSATVIVAFLTGIMLSITKLFVG